MKFALRRNLIYPFQLLIFNVLRDTESTLISTFFNFSNPLIYTPLMFLGEFSAGIIIYSYHKKFLSNNDKEKESTTSHKIKLIQNQSYLTAIDSNKKIIFLIFISAFFDFVQFMISLNTPKFLYISGSIESRLGGFLTIFDALFYYYVLRFRIYRHQLFSLIVIGICLGIVVISEFFFQEINIFVSYGQFFAVIFLNFVKQFCSAMVDSVEKYLFEYNKLNQFLALMFEGIFGFILSFFYSLFYSPFGDFILFKKNHSSSDFAILIFMLLLYSILSGAKNAFRVTTTKVYSPMATTFLDYILNPFYMIYDFASKGDYITNGKSNLAYFIINLFLSLIISFCGCVYNEFLILFFCNLERDTYNQIIRRSSLERELNSLSSIPDFEEYGNGSFSF